LYLSYCSTLATHTPSLPPSLPPPLKTDALDVLVLGLVPIAVIGKVYQNISPDGASIANVVELSQGASQLSFFPLLGKLGDSMARLRVEASSEVLSPSRLSLTFKSAGFEPVTLFGMEVGKQLSLPKVRRRGREGGTEGGMVWFVFVRRHRRRFSLR